MQALVGVCLLALASGAQARSSYLSDWSGIYPDSSSDQAGCQLCHGASTGDLNLYGFDLALCSGAAGGITTRIVAIEALDSDGDPGSADNITEITESTQPGWTSGANPVFDRDNCAPAGSDQPPGGLVLDPTLQPPAAPDIAVAPRSIEFGAVNVGASAESATTVSNLGDADLNVSALDLAGSIDFSLGANAPGVPFTVTPGASVEVPLSYAPGEEGADDGTLSIVSDSPGEETLTVSLSGTGIVPPPEVCVIRVNPTALDYGTVEIGAPLTLVTTVSNDGTVDCAVTATVDSTTGEFALASAQTVTVTPGTSADVAVAYAPVDVGDDAGTLTLDSNDPARPSVAVPLAGSGVEATPVLLDLDIAQFRTTGRVRLARVKPVEIQLTVLNAGVAEGSALATVVGTQDGIEVYRETLEVSDAVGNGRTRVPFPSYVPDAAGEILWTAILADEDPDDDVATATTVVR
jgi:hypothetical protein